MRKPSLNYIVDLILIATLIFSIIIGVFALVLIREMRSYRYFIEREVRNYVEETETQTP